MSGYRQQIVAFLDILGYSDLVEKVKDNPKEVTKTIETISRAIEKCVKRNVDIRIKPDEEPTPEDPKYTVFSDSICVYADCIADAKPQFLAGSIFSFLLQLVYIQAELTLHGVFIRGGVVLGQHYHEGEVMFSPALINAYRIESKKAVYPRICLDETVTKKLYEHDHESNYQFLNALIKRDADGLVFLDYLSYVDELDDEATQRWFLHEHKGIVESKLNASQADPYVTTKYLWLARYHNQKIRVIFDDPNDAQPYLVDERLLGFRSDIFKNPVAYVLSIEFGSGETRTVFVKAPDLWTAKTRVKAEITGVLEFSDEFFTCHDESSIPQVIEEIRATTDPNVIVIDGKMNRG